MGLFNQNDSEKEVSGGAVFGYVLLGMAAVVVVAFIIFVVISKVKGSSDDSATESSRIEQSVNYEDLASLGYTFSDTEA
jgi:uncharacterized membrane protein